MITSIRKNIQNSDIMLGIGLIIVLILIIIPIPGFILDILIAFSFFAAIVVIMTALGSKNPADFSVFPTLLLLTTIYRLALNISTTRMILTKGGSFSSHIIDVFGTMVVGGGRDLGSYVTGIIIFLILTLVQVMVITRGATRVSEVAARFALDSMPGKQLAIDSDLAAGYINEKEARSRRERLQTEMGFYGAMDGASKFVQGDVRFGLVLIAINVMGGLIIGTSIRGESFISALTLYTRLTIGDGLVTAIPALLITSATGVIVSRSVGDKTLPEDLRKELFSNPKILYIAGSILGVSAFIPGFPFFTMILISGFIFYLARILEKELKKDATIETENQKTGDSAKTPDSYLQHLRTETLEIEIGYNLVPLVDKSTGGTLLEQISRLRKRFALENGLVVPPVRVRDNMNLQPNEYLIRLQGAQIGKATLEPEKLMAIDTGRVTKNLSGNSFKEPTYNLTSYWIEPDEKSEAENSGYDVVDCSTVIATHLSNIIQQNSSDIMGRREIKSILDSIKQDDPSLIDEVLTDKKISVNKIQAILQYLLREGFAIRNMNRILETIADQADRTGGDPFLLSEAIRINLKRQLIEDLIMDDKKELHVVTLDATTERKIRDGLHRDPIEGFVVALHPDFHTILREKLLSVFKELSTEGNHVIFLCSSTIRAGLFHILERILPKKNFSVLSHEEIPNDITVKVVNKVKLDVKNDSKVAVATS